MMYGFKYWTLNKKRIKVKVTYMRMLRWMCGVNKSDRKNNENIKGSLGVMNVAEKWEKIDWDDLDLYYE